MSTRRLTTTTALALLVAAFPLGAARAQVEAIRLSYDAYPGCPSEAQFVGDVTARTDRARRSAQCAPNGQCTNGFCVCSNNEQCAAGQRCGAGVCVSM
jgi:hypothetical protein